MPPRLCGLPEGIMPSERPSRNGHHAKQPATEQFPESLVAVLVADAIASESGFVPPYWFSRETIARWAGLSQNRINERLRTAGIGRDAGRFIDVRQLGDILVAGCTEQD